MPRKSAASLAIVPAAPVRLAPVPEGLSDSESRLWRETVESKPADWFGADSYPILKEYVRTASVCDQLARVVDLAFQGAGTDLKTALDLRDKEAKRLASLATKLRLTPQSRYGPRAAATADAKANGRRPWQSAG